MGRRIIVLDESVFDQINRGNQSVAKVLRNLILEDPEFWVTAQLRTLLTTEADQRLLRDLDVHSPAEDYYAGSRGDGRRGDVVMERYVERLPAHARTTGALVIRLSRDRRQDAELMTADRAFSDAFNRYYGKVVQGTPQLTTIRGDRVPGDIRGVYDYNQARRLLGLRQLLITTDGRIVRRPPPAALPTPPKPIATLEPSPKGNAKFQAARIGLDAVNYFMQRFNDTIQQRRFTEAWAKQEPVVRQQLEEDPTLGALILVFYSKRQKVGAENDSPLEHVPVFQYIDPAYGYTREDALARYRRRPQLRPAGTGELIMDDSQFIPPKQAVDVTKLPTPFPALGLATFVAGQAEVLGVKWRGRSGFDETSATSLDVPAGVRPLFLILQPPDRMTAWNGDWPMSVDIDIGHEYPAGIGPAMHLLPPVPVVELDAWYNLISGGTSACMAYPASNVTALLFQRTGPTKDNNNQLRNYRMELLRWVEPENILLLRYFPAEQVKP